MSFPYQGKIFDPVRKKSEFNSTGSEKKGMGLFPYSFRRPLRRSLWRIFSIDIILTYFADQNFQSINAHENVIRVLINFL